MPEYAEEENYMNIKPFRYIYRTECFTFGMCGLNVRKNFVHMRKDQNYKYIQCPDDKSVSEFCTSLIGRSPCQNCAVFVIKLDGDILLFLHDETMQNSEADRLCLQPKIGVNKDFYVLGDIAKEMGLECYGLIAEVEHNIYQVIER